MKTARVIALGFFDGVHIGHGALLSRCAERAMELGAVPAAHTFDIHPSALLCGRPVPLLTTVEDRAGLMRRLYGITDVLVGHYDERMRATPWREFVTGTLLRENGAIHLVAGEDFRFGYRGEGDAARLKALCGELGLGCDVIPKVTRGGEAVSSTRIRRLVARGEMAEAVALLGHPHLLTGRVLHGKGLGAGLGFPTANLAPPSGLAVPAYGAYAARVALDSGKSWPAVTNVGVRPTLGDGNAVTVESWLLGFDGDLYGQTIRVELYTRLRPERRFASPQALRAQVRADADLALAVIKDQGRAFFLNGKDGVSPGGADRP